MIAKDRCPETFNNMKEILTKHFHIFSVNEHTICYFEIQKSYKEYIMWEFTDHKISEKIVWKI